MHQPYYPFEQTHINRYTFVSHGKREIKKAVEFSRTKAKDLYNMGFGDILSDGSIDDTANSNNGDMIKVLATVIRILRVFTMKNPTAKIFFTGSTDERTRLYGRILRTYYDTFSKEFKITASTSSFGSARREVPFDPAFFMLYSVFYIRRNT